MDTAADQHLLEQANSGQVLCPGRNGSFWDQMNSFEQEKGGN